MCILLRTTECTKSLFLCCLSYLFLIVYFLQIHLYCLFGLQLYCCCCSFCSNQIYCRRSRVFLGRLVLPACLSSLQKHSHVKLAGTKVLRPFYRTKTWWCGFVLTCVGEGANFVSYAFAPLSLIAPLNAVSVVGQCCSVFSNIRCLMIDILV